MSKDAEHEKKTAADSEFQKRLLADPAGTLAELGIELLESEKENLRGSLKEFIARSLQTPGSATLEHKITRTIGDRQITFLLALRQTNTESPTR